MPIYDYKCKCGKEKEVFAKWGDEISCPDCNSQMKRLISGNKGISMGVGAYGYYDDTLQTDITTNAQKKRLMKEQGVSESYGKGWV